MATALRIVDDRPARSNVGDLDDLLRSRDAAKGGVRDRADERFASPRFGVCRRRAVHAQRRGMHRLRDRYRVPNLASQMRIAFSSMAWNTGSSSPGELEMTRSTSEVAVCCSSASASCFPRFGELAGVRASSFFSRSALGTRASRPTRVLAFVPLERSLRPPVRLFAPLRDKVTPGGTSIDPGSPGHRHLKHNTAGPAVGVAIYSVPHTETGRCANRLCVAHEQVRRLGRYLRAGGQV